MPRKEPLYPHVPKSRMKKTKAKPTRDDVRVEVWEERDRLHIGIQDKETGDYYASWWDDEARQMFEGGFFKRRPNLEESVLDYAEEMGILAKESSEAKRVYTPPELAKIAEVFYEAQARRKATIYAGLSPMYTRWENLTQSQRDETIRGLQERIEREGLKGYLERKRSVVGDELTEEIVHGLERRGYL